MPRSTYKISHHFSSLCNRWPNWQVSKQNLFYTKIPIPLHIFPPTYLDANLPSSNVHRHDARRSLHYTHRAIFRSIIYAQRRSATCYIHHLYPHHSNFIYVYEFYEILISPWEIITLISAITDSIRPNSFNTLPVTCISPNIVDIQGSVKVLDNDFLWI